MSSYPAEEPRSDAVQAHGTESANTPRKPVTVPEIAAHKDSANPLVMVTAYDASSARAAEAGGAEIILVGDSLGMVVLGYDSTLEVTVDDMVRHTAAVTRSCSVPLVVADMPYMSYHTGVSDAVRNAGRLVVEGKAKAVKVEGGRKRVPVIEAMLDAEIPVMGHIGLTPQSVNALGGYKVQGKALDAAQELVDDAKALASAGVFALVLECVPAPLARLVTEAIDVPTIGIGAGPFCDGQVLVYHDLLGLFEGHRPKFVRRFADLGSAAAEGIRAYASAVRSREFPSDTESYTLPEDVAGALEARFKG
ncbi:MAG: 3-methyl-2-oxobutanoate hydroxymethyltransferase [Acidobacteria bacterium]|nr:MAG: 3-methyl-2-oxobutanoate hydroxymethyltransferase [Acidobacteriota bacterium]